LSVGCGGIVCCVPHPEVAAAIVPASKVVMMVFVLFGKKASSLIDA
jgi:hypothetical protein